MIFTDSYHVENGFKNHIEMWLDEEKIQFNTINEPNHLFHYVLKNMQLDIPIEIFQEKNNPDLIIGLMTFLSDELNFKLYKFTQLEKESFKIKVDEFLSTIRMDYRTGLRVGYAIISENGHYGAKYFVKTNTDDFDKEKLLKILNLVKSIYKESELFLKTTLNN